jgi:hypothetical protein
VIPKGTPADLQQIQQRLEKVAGVSRVVYKEARDGRLRFMIESLQGRHIRPDLARAVIEAGWGLNELHAVGLSLEEIFLQLTTSTKEGDASAKEADTGLEVPAAAVHAEETK